MAARKNITSGRRFGRWIVLYEMNPKKAPSGKLLRRFFCRCDCGTEKPVWMDNLGRRGQSLSCGCLSKEVTSELFSRHVSAGDKFGYWTVLEELPRHYHPDGNPRRKFLCRCICGRITEVLSIGLFSKETRSCGCRGNAEVDIERIKKAWCTMIARCENKNSTSFKNYGARGISVCQRWHDFDAFISDMGVPESAGLTIDRIDVNGNYEPNNCRWVTYKDQAQNKR